MDLLREIGEAVADLQRLRFTSELAWQRVPKITQKPSVLSSENVITHSCVVSKAVETSAPNPTHVAPLCFVANRVCTCLR